MFPVEKSVFESHWCFSGIFQHCKFDNFLTRMSLRVSKKTCFLWNLERGAVVSRSRFVFNKIPTKNDVWPQSIYPRNASGLMESISQHKCCLLEIIFTGTLFCALVCFGKIFPIPKISLGFINA